MGDVVRFAVRNRDIVRSVNFQPVAHFGRYAKNDGRFAIDDAARLLADQLEPVEARDLLPAPCCSSYCQIGTALVSQDAQASVAAVNGAAGAVVDADLPDAAADDTPADSAQTADDTTADSVQTADCGCTDGECGGDPATDATGAATDEFVPLTKFVDDHLWDTLTGLVDERDYMELLAGTAAGQEWACKTAGCCGLDVPEEMTGLFDDVVPITLTGFMDADGADVNRLDNCCISVPTPEGDLVPFCGYNMTTEDGEYALRNRNGWGGRPSVAEPSGGGYDGGVDETGTTRGGDGSRPDRDVPAPDGGQAVSDAGDDTGDGVADAGDACGCGPSGCGPDGA
jgi:hypothetical protein